tara:strand:- start:1640 stop:2377 length:738 start_codon:yes stop_codon:yes gene_type:complete
MNNLSNKEISVIVPFYNEEKFIEQSILRLIDTNLFKKIILVNDKSSDTSGQIAEKICEQFDSIELVNLDNQKGKGNAVRVGLERVKTSHLIVHDADLEYFPSDIPEMFEAAKMNPSCLVIGSRTIGKKKRNNKYKITYYGNKILTYFFSLINLYTVSDIASCYWLIETEVLKKLDIKEKGFAIEVEVLSKFLLGGNKIFEVPINYDGRLYSEGKKIKLKDGIFIFIKIIKYSKLLSIFKFRKPTY